MSTFRGATGGIYRDAWLEDYDPLHFALQPFATSGVKVTPYLDMGLGVINVDLTIANEDAIKREATLRLNLYNPEARQAIMKKSHICSVMVRNLLIISHLSLSS